jgi:hypothetical protein
LKINLNRPHRQQKTRRPETVAREGAPAVPTALAPSWRVAFPDGRVPGRDVLTGGDEASGSYCRSRVPATKNRGEIR